MTERELAAIVKGIVTEVRAQLAPQLMQLDLRTKALEQRAPQDGSNGRDGVDGRPGTDGRDGRDAPTLEELRPLIQGTVTQALAAVPKVKDGISVTGALIDRAGHLVLTRSEGAPIDVGMVTGATGPTGEPGRDGKDAAFKGAIMLKVHDARTFEWCWSADGTPVEIRDAADKVIPSRFTLPIPIHKDVWRAGAYDAHDIVTHDGSEWRAKTATTTRPGNGASDWVLIVKRGAQGPKGETGPAGPPGRDLTSMTFDGTKYR